MSRFTTYDTSKTGTAVAAASEIALDMTERRQYALRCTGADLWFRVTNAGGAAAAVGGDGSHFLPAGAEVRIARIGTRNRVSVIRAAATDATAILSEVVETTS